MRRSPHPESFPLVPLRRGDKRGREVAMRLLLALFAFVALGLAPMGTPAEARAPEEHCAEIGGTEHRSPEPSSEHGSPAPVKSCCAAMAAALPDASSVELAPVLRASVLALTLPVQNGLRREVEVPPPRA